MKKQLMILCSLVILSLVCTQKTYAKGKFRPYAQVTVGFAGGDNVPRWEYGQGLPDNDDNKFHAAHRFRVGFEYIVDENLSANILFQQGYSLWGEDIAQMDTRLDALDNDIKLRLAYVDWTVPTTKVKVRMGIQDFMLPSSVTLGSPILYSRTPGVIANTPVTENLRLTGFWTGADLDGYINSGIPRSRDIHIFGGILDFNYDNFRIAPFATQTMMGSDADKNYGPSSLKNTVLYPGNADVTHAGISMSSSSLSPFIFALDAAYSMSKFNAPDEKNGNGWFAMASTAYKTKYGVPKFMAWYSSGDKEGDEPLRHNFITIRGGFNATSVLFGDDPLCPAYGYRDGVHGTTAAILEWSQISFFNKISHTARAMYLRGTNDNANIQFIRNKSSVYAIAIANSARRMNYLTDDDTVIEININTDYKMSRNTTISIDLGYMNVDLEDRLASDNNIRETYRTALHFLYSF